jgi:hypothetical protein
MDTPKYPKIQGLFKRDGNGNFIIGDYSDPIFDYLKNNIWLFTEKIDGMNMRVTMHEGEVIIQGRTDRAQIPKMLDDRIHELFGRFVGNSPSQSKITLFGEGYGRKIQKSGSLYLSDANDFILFDVLIDNKWQNREIIEALATYFMVDAVPLIGEGTLLDGISMIKSGSCISKFGNFRAEGIVAKPKADILDGYGGRIITKIKHIDFGHSMRIE